MEHNDENPGLRWKKLDACSRGKQVCAEANCEPFDIRKKEERIRQQLMSNSLEGLSI
jgi:hypothetical protein